MDIHTYYIYLYTLYAHAPIAAAAAACLKSAGQGRTGSANTFLRSPRNESENRKARRERRDYTISWGYSWTEGSGGNHHHNDHRKGQTSAAAPTHRCSISGGSFSSNALRLSIAVCKLQNNRAPQTSSMFRHVRTWLMSAAPKKKEEAAHTSLAKQTTSRIRSVVSAQYVGSSINSKLFFRSLVSCASHFID